MCILCTISPWSRRAASKLPWLVIPFIIVWALSQLFPPSYRLEITSSRLVCIGVLLLRLVWYEFLMPWISSRRAHKSAAQRDQKLIEALEAAKRRKEATRRCRNCLTAYKTQMPGSGKYVCTYCGHISKRPVLEVAGKLANVRLAMSESGVDSSGAGLPHMRSLYFMNGSCTSLHRPIKINRFAQSAENSFLAEDCSLRHLLLKSWLFLWRKVSGVGVGKADVCTHVNGQPEMMDDTNRNRVDRARRKADKKKRVRLQKELLEAEDRKQREEVALLVEERRRQRDEFELLQRKETETHTQKPKEIKKERENEKQAEKPVKKSAKSDTNEPLDQGQEQGAGCGSETMHDRLSPSSGSSKEQNNGPITMSKSARASEQNRVSKYKSTMDSLSRLAFLKRLKSAPHKTAVSVPPVSISPQSENIPQNKNVGTCVGKSRTPSGCSNLSLGTTGDTKVPVSAWKRAPWVSGWVKGSKEVDCDSNSLVKEAHSDKKWSPDHDSNALFDCSNDLSLIDRPSRSPVRTSAIQPPRALSSTCADPLQQLFSTPSLFSPMDLCTNGNLSPGQRLQNEAKSVFSPEHSFFEAQKFASSTDAFMAPTGLSFIEPISDTDISLAQPAFCSSLSKFSQNPSLPDTSYESIVGYNDGPTCKISSRKLPCDSDVAQSLGAAVPALLSGTLRSKKADFDLCTENMPLWENDVEEALELSSLSTVEALLETDLFISDTHLLSPEKSGCQKLKEDILSEAGPGSDHTNLLSAMNASLPVWDDVDCSQNVPAEFVDCNTQEIMEDSVITADGHLYEQAAIKKWLEHHDASPKTGEVLPPPPGGIGVDKTLCPNHILKSQVIEYKNRLTGMSDSQWTVLRLASTDGANVLNTMTPPHVLSF